MTELEKQLKIATAKSDIESIKNTLNYPDLYKENSIVQKIMSNIDYVAEITGSRIKNDIPSGNHEYVELQFAYRREVLNMLLEAVQTALAKFEVMRTENTRYHR